jgi:hypothetical protein
MNQRKSSPGSAKTPWRPYSADRPTVPPPQADATSEANASSTSLKSRACSRSSPTATARYTSDSVSISDVSRPEYIGTP